MRNNFASFRSLLAKSAFLMLAVFLILSASNTNGIAASSSNTVNVNARIQPARVVKITGGSSNQSRQTAFTPVDLTDFEKTDGKKIEIRKTISLSLASNVSWNLTARIENLSESREIIRSSGWKLKAFRIHWSGGELKLDNSAQTMISGGRGKQEFEITYEVILLRTDGRSQPTFLDELENVLVFAFE